MLLCALISLLLQFVPSTHCTASTVFLEPSLHAEWSVGRTYAIVWNASAWPVKTSAVLTPVSLQLGRQSKFRRMKWSVVVAEAVPLSLGRWVWTVPSLTQLNQSEPDEGVYAWRLFPTAMDGPEALGGCPSCLKDAPMSPVFTITSASTNTSSVDPLPPGEWMVYDPDTPLGLSWVHSSNPSSTNNTDSDALMGMRVVGFIVAGIAVCVMALALLIYTRRRHASRWQRSTLRTTGPVVDPSPLRHCTASASALKKSQPCDDSSSDSSEDESPTTTAAVVGAETEAERDRRDLLPQHASMPTLLLPRTSSARGNGGTGYTQPKILTQTAVVVSPKTSKGLMIPVSSSSVVSSVASTPSNTLASTPTPSNTPTTLTPTHTPANTPTETATMLNPMDAILVGNTFRNVLRVATPVLVQEDCSDQEDVKDCAEEESVVTVASAGMLSQSPVLGSFGMTSEQGK